MYICLHRLYFAANLKLVPTSFITITSLNSVVEIVGF